jgi:hypothetical protein
LKVVVDVPRIVDAPLNTTVPKLLVNVPLLEKSPANVNVPEVEVNAPALIVRLLILTFVVPKANVPAPDFVRLTVVGVIGPLIESVEATVFIVGLPEITVAPVPRFSVLAAPMYVKLPWICKG